MFTLNIYYLAIYLFNKLIANLILFENKINVTHSFLDNSRDNFTFSKKLDVPLSNNDFMQYTKKYNAKYSLFRFLQSYNSLDNYYKLRFFLIMYSLYFCIGFLFSLKTFYS